MYYSIYDSPIGEITIACDKTAQSLVGLWIDGQKYHGNSLFADMTKKTDLPLIEKTKQWLSRYFAGEKPSISELPLAPIGSEFRQAVWKILCEIPYGQVISYGDIAKQMAVKTNKSAMSSRAVGGAVGHNPISIIIPCHRVIGSNGTLTGYAGGINIKSTLLKLEGAKIH